MSWPKFAETRSKTIGSKPIIVAASLLGLLGVAAAALSAHASVEPRLTSAVALVALAHAPTILALCSFGVEGRAVWSVAVLLLIAGTLLFGVDLMLRAFAGTGAFPYAAPIGGYLMMGGWVAIAVGAFVHRPRSM